MNGDWKVSRNKLNVHYVSFRVIFKRLKYASYYCIRTPVHISSTMIWLRPCIVLSLLSSWMYFTEQIKWEIDWSETEILVKVLQWRQLFVRRTVYVAHECVRGAPWYLACHEILAGRFSSFRVRLIAWRAYRPVMSFIQLVFSETLLDLCEYSQYGLELPTSVDFIKMRT